MNLKAPRNENYCAVVVDIKNTVDIGLNTICATSIFGNQVLVSKALELPARGLFFPAGTQLMPAFLKANNLYRKAELNQDPTKTGFFDENGRVRALRLQGHKSEGFWIPVSCLLDSVANELQEGDAFDFLDDFEICRKYVVPGKTHSTRLAGPKKARAIDRIVADQFRFHEDTSHLGRNLHRIMPETLISITNKWHGTSVIVGNLPIKEEEPLYKRLLRKIGFRVEHRAKYGTVWASRRVVKGVGGVPREGTAHFYSSDVWGDVARELEGRIPQGVTLYGEIVGYTKDGSPIQPGYAYGCGPREFKFVAYRATITNLNGDVFEMGTPQLTTFCKNAGIGRVPLLYYGLANSYRPIQAGEGLEDWQKGFLTALLRTVEGRKCIYNGERVPAEGVVVRFEDAWNWTAFKCKSFEFVEHETKAMDAGQADIEDEN